MAFIEKSIHVGRPIRTVYDQWARFEEFPRFMQGVRQVHQVDGRHLRWRIDTGGREESWDAEIIHQEPCSRIGWRNTSGPYDAGLATFHPAGGGTEVTLRIDYEPSGLLEEIGDSLARVSRCVEGDLQRFKRFIEAREQPADAWRGEFDAGAETGQR